MHKIHVSHISSLLRHGLKANTAWQKISVKKDRKGVSVQTILTFISSFNTGCLKFKFLNNTVAKVV